MSAVVGADPLSDAVLDRVAGMVGSSRGQWSRTLLGGSHARTDVVRTDVGQELVLRRFPVHDDAVTREARVLEALDGLDSLAPTPTAHTSARRAS